MEHTILKGLLVWCVSLIAAFDNLARSTVRLGSPFFLHVITILVHHVSGTPGGTRSKIPLFTSASIPLATFSLQCNGTAAGLWTRCGTASGFVCILMGGPCVSGIFCLLQTLKALLLKYSFIQTSIHCLFCVVAGNGTFCVGWTCSLVGHEQGRGLSGSHSPLGGRPDGELIKLLTATHRHLWKGGGQHVEFCDGCYTEEVASFP